MAVTQPDWQDPGNVNETADGSDLIRRAVTSLTDREPPTAEIVQTLKARYSSPAAPAGWEIAELQNDDRGTLYREITTGRLLCLKRGTQDWLLPLPATPAPTDVEAGVGAAVVDRQQRIEDILAGMPKPESGPGASEAADEMRKAIAVVFDEAVDGFLQRDESGSL
ncbi:hypothetical protein [Streptomyces sp. NPDC047028]|uniref:hypothetical protein n=1 Tax=Streptomyces sp. NPDC047028 TaxID=3155793 RepID=UPI0033EF5171